VLVDSSGELAVVKILTCRPDRVRAGRTEDLVPALERRLNRTVTVEIVPEAQAIARTVRAPVNKARRLMREMRGKRVLEALSLLQFVPNRVAEPLGKLLMSAVANAENGWGADPALLRISLLKADEGMTIKRIRPRAQGRAYRILRRTSHLSLAVQDAEAPPEKTRRRQRGAAEVTRV